MYGGGETGFWLGGPKVRDQWEDLGVGVRIKLRWTLGRQGSMGRTGFGWLRIGPLADFFEYGNASSSSIFFDKLTIDFSKNTLHYGVSK